jgi:hypothetical protein
MRDYFSDRLGEVLGPGDERDLYLAFMLAGHHSLIQFWLAERPDIEPRVVAATLNRLYYAPFFLTTDDGAALSARPDHCD